MRVFIVSGKMLKSNEVLRTSYETGEKKMKNILNLKLTRKTVLSGLAVVLMLTFAVSLLSVPIAEAHIPTWTIPTYAYIVAAPNL